MLLLLHSSFWFGFIHNTFSFFPFWKKIAYPSAESNVFSLILFSLDVLPIFYTVKALLLFSQYGLHFHTQAQHYDWLFGSCWFFCYLRCVWQFAVVVFPDHASPVRFSIVFVGGLIYHLFCYFLTPLFALSLFVKLRLQPKMCAIWKYTIFYDKISKKPYKIEDFYFLFIYTFPWW